MSLSTTPLRPLDEKVAAASGAKFAIAVQKIVDETGLSEQEGRAAVCFIEEMAMKARRGGRGAHRLVDDEKDTLGHDVLELIIPHGATARLGSAHAAVQDYVLGAMEFTLMHVHPTGREASCTVSLDLSYVG